MLLYEIHMTFLKAFIIEMPKQLKTASSYKGFEHQMSLSKIVIVMH